MTNEGRIELDDVAMFKLRMFGYNISEGHMRFLLRQLAEAGLSAEDVSDAYHGFSTREACELLDVDLFELYALLIYFGVRHPTSQRSFASRRAGARTKRTFTEDGQVRGE